MILPGFATELLGGPLPTFDVPQLVTTPELGQQLYAAMGDAAGVLMRWHGTTIVGLTLDEMFTRAVMLEENARILWEARALGGSILRVPDAAVAERERTGHEETYVRTLIYHSNLEREIGDEIHSGATYGKG